MTVLTSGLAPSDIVDLRAGLDALKDPADPVLDWSEVRDALLGVDEANAV